jgi:hypothetical protein
MEWGFLWIMVGLKIPLAALLWLVWWAVRQTPEEAEPPGDDGGGPHTIHPHGPVPVPPRRGPHREPAPPAPARVRAGGRRARTPER